MKYAIVDVTDYYGAYEFGNQFLLKAKTQKKIKELAEIHTLHWWDDSFGEVKRELDSVKFIPESHYRVLKKYLTEL